MYKFLTVMAQAKVVKSLFQLKHFNGKSDVKFKRLSCLVTLAIKKTGKIKDTLKIIAFFSSCWSVDD